MFEHLDDPVPLLDASYEQRQAVMSRGASLRRRRRAGAIGAWAIAAAAAASPVLALSDSSRPSGGELLTPAAPPPLELVLQASQTTDPAYGACPDPFGDSTGEPDVTLFSLDRPLSPLVHYHWESGELSPEAVVELRFEATSADGLRARQLVARTVDGKVAEQFLRDPRTGARLDVPHATQGPGGGGLAASFPPGALGGLGDDWTWVASLGINGTVVDSCDPAHDPRNLIPGQ